MFKKVNNWHLSFLIIIVSVLSVSIVQKYAIAAWQEPTSVPGTTANQNIVLNPMTTNLDLDEYLLTGYSVDIDGDGSNAITLKNGANLCFGASDCRNTWPTESTQIWSDNDVGIDYVNVQNPNVGIGTDAPSEFFHVSGGNMLVSDGSIIMDDDVSIQGFHKNSFVNIMYLENDTGDLVLAGDDINFQDLSGNSLVYVDDIGTIANVGIGTNIPNKSLHIKTPANINAEINLESGTNTHWGMYQDETTTDLRFWHDDDVVVFDSAGYVGIGTSNPNHQLHVESTNENAVYGEAQLTGKYGVLGENTVSGGFGLGGIGQYGIRAESSIAGGAGLIAYKGSSDYAGMFRGALRLYNAGSNNAYLHLATVSVDPPTTDCDSIDETGRMIYNSADDQLFICSGSSGWSYPDMQVVIEKK